MALFIFVFGFPLHCYIDTIKIWLSLHTVKRKKKMFAWYAKEANKEFINIEP